MDVLKEITRAEKQAAEIEKGYAQRIASMELSVPARIGEARAAQEAELGAEIETLRGQRERRVEEEKKAIAARAAQEKETLRKRAKDAEPGAVDIILKKLGL